MSRYSFVLLAYNQEDTIAEALDGAFAQEGPEIELFLSDDCSSDRTFRIMQEKATAYDGPHRIVLNRNDQNLGVNRHINLSIRRSSGEAIIAASGDDISFPHRSLKCAEAFEAGAKLVHSHAIVGTKEGDPARYPYENALFFQSTQPIDAATAKALYLGATCAWHKSLYEKYGPVPEGPAFEDLILGFRASLEHGVAFVDEPLVRYRVGTGLSNSKRPQGNDARKARQLELQREIATLNQRLRDCDTYGRAQLPEVVDRIERRILDVEKRYSVATSGAIRTLVQQPGISALRAVVAEANSRRKL